MSGNAGKSLDEINPRICNEESDSEIDNLDEVDLLAASNSTTLEAVSETFRAPPTGRPSPQAPPVGTLITSQPARSRMGGRQQRGPRLSWSQADKKLFISFFAKDIARANVPGKEAVEQFIQRYPQNGATRRVKNKRRRPKSHRANTLTYQF